MVGMFATLLDLARIQAGVVKPEIEAVRLADVVDRIVAEHPGSSIEADDTNVLLRTDPLLLERLLRNLVSNALKHGGGSARIEIAQHGEEVEICVADAGPGIAEEDQARIFEEFVRLDGPAEGLGLGLAIVKRIADLLHMPLSLESAPGKGARFSIRAPIEREGAHTQVGREAVDRLDGAKVLVIDDDSLARSAVSRMLSDLGAEVRACGNEADALTLIREGFTPELLVMDLRLDGALAGVDVARRLVQLIEPSSKVIVITGDTAAETLTMLRGSGYPWLIKPVDPREMTAKAAEALRSVEPVNST
jgi:CheY-like chemotaxis protein